MLTQKRRINVEVGKLTRRVNGSVFAMRCNVRSRPPKFIFNFCGPRIDSEMLQMCFDLVLKWHLHAFKLFIFYNNINCPILLEK